MMHYLLILLIGYLLGCSNMAVYLAAAQNVDLRSGGSGNPGASNALILMGWRAGLLVGAHDIAKAVLAVLLCRLLFPPFRSRALYRAPPASPGTCSRSICAFTGERALPPISA